MANYQRFVWQQRTFIALAAATGSFLIGLILPIHKQPDPSSLISATEEKETQLKEKDKSITETTTVTAQGHEALKKIAALLEQEVKDRRLTFAIPQQFQGKTLKEVKLSTQEKVIALTFDDGPWPVWTTKILDILKKNNIKATFFVVGQCVKNFPQLTKQTVAEGHAIGNHTWSHLYHNFSEAGAAREIDRTAAILYETTGVKTSLFRPPGGHLKNGLAAYAQKNKYSVVMWSADSTDYRRPAAQTMVNRIIHASQPGGIVLMHDGGGERSNTVQALPKLIAEYKKQGYKFVTLPELLEMKEKEVKLAAKTKSSPSSK